MRYHYTPTRINKIKIETIPSVSKSQSNWNSHAVPIRKEIAIVNLQNYLAVSTKMIYILTLRLSNSTPGHLSINVNAYFPHKRHSDIKCHSTLRTCCQCIVRSLLSANTVVIFHALAGLERGVLGFLSTCGSAVCPPGREKGIQILGICFLLLAAILRFGIDI